jgi:pilus assembly protein CpaD
MMTMTHRNPIRWSRSVAAAGALLGLALALGGCQHTADDVTGTVPEDYRLRHPIAIEEHATTIDVFVGTERGGLNANQRADVIALGQNWLREGTGAIMADVPVNTPNARAAKESFREIQSLLTASGVPAQGLVMRSYRSDNPRLFATIRLSYPLVGASAGPCGTWPEDLASSVKNKSYLANKPYYNLGCSQQRNLAAMVANPSDLVQPRPEGPVYAARRTVGLDKYRKGESTASNYPDADKTKISNVGQ